MSITALRDKAMKGRPRIMLAEPLELFLLNEVSHARGMSVATTVRDLAKKAAELGIEAPSRAVVRARLADVPHELRVVAAYGRPAAVADAMQAARRMGRSRFTLLLSRWC